MSRSSIAVATLSVLTATSVAACYPEFHFSGGTGGLKSSTTGEEPDTSSSSSADGGGRATVGSTAESTSVTTTTTTDSSVASSSMSSSAVSSGNGNFQAPCAVTGDSDLCNVGADCCFDMVSFDDFCTTSTCTSDHADLACVDDSSCAGGKHCCAIYSSSTHSVDNVTGTECRADCTGSTVLATCQNGNVCPASQKCYYLLNYTDPPYDVYGECH